MPKINVYLPDDLAAAVRAAGFPVSPVCQQALAAAVRAVTDARKAISAIRDPGFDPARYPAIGTRVEGRMTARLGQVFALARQADGGEMGTVPLLLAMLDEGSNIGLRLLQAIDIDLDELRDDLQQAGPDEPAASAGAADASGAADDGSSANAGPDQVASVLDGVTRSAWRAMAGAVEASIDMGHNYIGSEHFVLGLIGEPGSAAGRVLQDRGAEPASARKALTSILAGYASGRQATQQAGPEAIGEIMRRLDALESRIAALPGVSG